MKKKVASGMHRKNCTVRLNTKEKDKIKNDAGFLGFENLSKYIRFRLGLGGGCQIHT
jgi:hypothetical protein